MSVELGLLGHHDPTSRPQVPLACIPLSTTLRRWHIARDGVSLQKAHEIQIRDFPATQAFLLVCFANLATDGWDALRAALRMAIEYGYNTMLVGSGTYEEIQSGLYGSRHDGRLLAACHGLVDSSAKRSALFQPTQATIHALEIAGARPGRICNALVLVRNGYATRHWVGQEHEPHDWTGICPLAS